MEFSFYYGPNKTPFFLNNDGMVESISAIPFHGIISRGLLIKLTEEELGYELWSKYAHLIDNEEDNQDPDLKQLQKYTRECGFMLFRHSAICAKEYIERFYLRISNENHVFCDIWNIKEGHTSSVWKVTITDNQHFIKDLFVINIARDKEAGFELKVTSEKMQIIEKNCPGINMAKVFDIKKLQTNFNNNPLEVVVTRNECIEDSYEIHMLNDKVNGSWRYILIERFLTREENPSQIASVYGRKFSKEESTKIKEDIDTFLNNSSSSIHTDLNINEGDVVWCCNTNRAVIIAIS